MNKILALDIATNTGWKTETASGTWNFTPKRWESQGMKLIRFKAKVKEIIDLEWINIISYERAAWMHKASIISESEMIGVVKLLAEELWIHLACYSATEIKKFATGKWNANKQMMIDKAIELGYNPWDDNEADAIHLYLLTVSDLGE